MRSLSARGQAGPALAERLTGAGMKVALAERHHPGGTCVNTGCIPTKTLVASARAAHVSRRARDFGVVIDAKIRVDMKAVKARKDEVALASRAGVTSWLESMDGLDFIRGHARFEANDRVRVGDEMLQADRIFINVGARARVPDFTNGVPYWTNSDMMEVDFLPRHLIIIGGGYIGLEFAQMYRRFGSEVTVVEMADRVLAREDEEVSLQVREFLEGEGIAFRTAAECVELMERANRVAVRDRLQRRTEGARRLKRAAGHGAGAQHSRPRHRGDRHQTRRPRIHRSRRRAPDACAWRLRHW